ncbi:MAG: TRAP transporter small permease [Planctomycetota bacterium]|jgi:TRAP-type C4-dicarboxylate transport system permease small subunit
MKKTSKIRRLDEGLLAVIRIAAGLLLVTMFVVIIWEVVTRYVFARPAFWTEEFARYTMFYMVLVGSAVSIRQELHPALGFVTKKFSARFQRIWGILIDVLVFLVLIAIFVEGLKMSSEEWIGKTPALRLRFFWVYLALPIGAFLMMVQLVAKYVFGKKAPDQAGEEFFE